MKHAVILLVAALAVFLCQDQALAQGKALSSVTTFAPAPTVFSSVLPRSDNRLSCVVTNIGTTQGFCQFKAGGLTVSTANAVPVAANGGQFSCGSLGAIIIIQDEVDCTCASGTCAFVVNSTGQ